MALQSPARLFYSAGPGAPLGYTGSSKDTGPDRHKWLHCAQIPCLVTTALSSEFCCFPVCMAHRLAFKMLILLLNDLQTTANSRLARWSWGTEHVCKDYCIQQQAPPPKKLTCSVNGSKLKEFLHGSYFIKQTEILVLLSGSFVTDFSASFAFNKYEKPLLLLHKTSKLPPGFTVVIWRLLLEYLNWLGILFNCRCLNILIH